MKKIITLLLCIAIFTGGCSSNNTETVKKDKTASPDYGGTVKMGCVPIDTLNPLITQHSSVSDFLSLVYDGLFNTKNDFTALPILASSFTVSSDNTVYTVKLRDGIKFHSGKTLTSEDVVSTLTYISFYGGRYSSVLESIAAYSADGDDKVIFTLSSPKSDFVNDLDFPILPSGLGADSFMAQNGDFIPDGTGMYKYDGCIKYKNIYLKYNPSWHGESGRPYIDNIDVEILSDSDTVISAFDSGETEILLTSWKNIDELGLTSNVYNKFSVKQNRFTYIGINSGAAAFDTKEERLSLSGLIDYEKLVEEITLGNGERAFSPIRSEAYYNTDSENVKSKNKNASSPDTAYREDNIDEDTHKINLLYNTGSKTKERLAMSLKKMIESGGYSVVLDGCDFETYSSKVTAQQYDLYVGEVIMPGSADLSFMFGSQRSSQNLTVFHSSELDALTSNLQIASDKNEKQVAFENFKNYYDENAIQIPLYFTDGAVFVNKRIHGKLTPNMSDMLCGFENLYIKEKTSDK